MTWNLISFIKSRRKTQSEAPGEKAASSGELTPLDLAFIGDSVFDLLVRESLLSGGAKPVKQLHSLAVEKVRAEAQAQAAHRILPLLTEEESEIFKRGRNAKVGGIPKSATPGQYHTATGLEALFGKLYLDGKGERINELFNAINEGE
ncbi:MAG: ribonuclease III [Clostridia bacterium]|nr:ribonuclease III [Clostridia bacterium]